MNKILIVEDDNTIHDMVKEYLNKRGFQCEHAYSGTEALLVQKQENCDLILMDLMLPGLDGKQALTKIKKEYDVPVIIVSAKNTIEDKVSLLAISYRSRRLYHQTICPGRIRGKNKCSTKKTSHR